MDEQEKQFIERRIKRVPFETSLSELRTLTVKNFETNSEKIKAIEANQEEHFVVLMQNTQMTKEMHGRFNVLESGIKTYDEKLATALSEWKDFQILKVDEGAKRMASIEDRLEVNIKATQGLSVGLDNLQIGIGDVLLVVGALKGTKKTLGWIGKTGLWFGSLALAWTAVKTALTSNIKVAWPWL